MEINFIKDKVLNLNDEEDLLGTKPYAITLFDLISKSEGQKNVGLFGSWGSGKSTILKTLKNLIDNHNSLKKNKRNNIGYFEFDAWKYSQDDFRRSFILEINAHFNVLVKPELEKLIYNEKTVERQGGYQFKFSLPDWIIFLLIVLSFVFYFLPVIDIDKDIRALISFFALTVTLLSTALGKTINRYKVVVKENKLIEPERFEEIFKETIDEITTIKSTYIRKWIQKNLFKKETYEKVVVVIDNLDRCDDENLMITLNTIKNFLEHKKVIFILPVDEKGVSAFLSEKTDNPEEFLRKIFHLIIRLKEFSRKEVFEFTKKLNDIYNLNLPYDSITLICQEFTGNPRKVIQFLNNYQSEMKLVEEQSKLGYIRQDFIKANLNFFIKILIIKYEWRDLYTCIIYEKSLLSKINSVITDLQEDAEGFYPIANSTIKLNDEQRNFFYSTQHIHCKKIEPFILNIDLDMDIPDEVSDNIRYGNYNKLVGYLIQKEHNFHSNDLIKKMNESYEEIAYKQNAYTFIARPLIALIIKFINDDTQGDFKEELKKNNQNSTFLKSLFENNKAFEIYDKLSFKNISLAVSWLLSNVNPNFYIFFQKYFILRYLSDSEQTNHIANIEEFIKIFKDEKVLIGIQSEFSSYILKKTHVARIDVLKAFPVSSQLISATAINKLSEILTSSKLESNSYDIEQILYNYYDSTKSDDYLQTNLTSYFIEKFENLYDTEEGIEKNVYSDYLYYFKRFITLIENNKEVNLPDTFINKIEAINEYFLNLYTVDFNEEDHLEILFEFLEFIQVLISNIENFNKVENRKMFFANYLERGHSKKIDLEVNKLIQFDINKYPAYEYPFFDELINKFKKDASTNKYDYAHTLLLMMQKSKNGKGLNENQKELIVENFIDNFTLRSFQPLSIQYLKYIKITDESLLESYINNKKLTYPSLYIKNVEKLNDNWFYGNSIFNLLKNNESNRSTLFKRLNEISKIVPLDIQKDALKRFLSESNIQTLKWLRLSYKTLDNTVFDIYLNNLLEAHRENKIGHNDLLEWIIKIPSKNYSVSRKKKFVEYLSGLEITHKTYAPKLEKAIKYLK